MNVSLRKTTDKDSQFAFSVKKLAFREYIEKSWGWDENTQLEIHERRFNTRDFRVISWGESEVGIMAVAVERDLVTVNQLFILPEYQSKGVGSIALGIVLDEAKALDVPLRLHVRQDNPRAIDFYERNGLRHIGATETHFILEKGPR